MSISSISSYVSSAASLLTNSKTTTTANSGAVAIDEEFQEFLNTEDARDTIKELSSGGLNGFMSWQIDNLKAKLTSQVMSEMGVTEESLSAMGVEEKAELEQKIMDKVQEMLEEQINNDMTESQNQILEENMLSEGVVSALLQEA